MGPGNLSAQRAATARAGDGRRKRATVTGRPSATRPGPRPATTCWGRGAPRRQFPDPRSGREHRRPRPRRGGRDRPAARLAGRGPRRGPARRRGRLQRLHRPHGGHRPRPRRRAWWRWPSPPRSPPSTPATPPPSRAAILDSLATSTTWAPRSRAIGHSPNGAAVAGDHDVRAGPRRGPRPASRAAGRHGLLVVGGDDDARGPTRRSGILAAGRLHAPTRRRRVTGPPWCGRCAAPRSRLLAFAARHRHHGTRHASPIGLPGPMDLADFDYDLPPGASPSSRSSPGTRPACWSTAGRRAPRPPHVADLPDLSARRPAGRQRHAGPARPAAAAQAHRAARSRCCCSSRTPTAGGRRWSAPAAGSGRAPSRRGRRPGGRRRRARPGDGRGEVMLRVHPGDDELAALDRHGEVPLPPYITAPLADPERYQTVYADRPGSVAAPTAGLHLTDDVLDRCRAGGGEVARVELVVGLDTFRPITADKVEDHLMHTERYAVPGPTLAACEHAGRAGGSSPSAPPASGRSSRRRRRAGSRAAPTCSSTALASSGWSTCCSPTSTCPGRRCSCWSTPSSGPAGASSTTTALAEGYRFLSFGDAMLVTRRDDPAASRVERDRRRGPGRRPSTTARGAFAHARASCRSAPGARCGPCRRPTSRTWASRSCWPTPTT